MAKQLRIAIVGKTGNGKSSVANSILGKTLFNTGLSANRVTKVTSSSITKRLSSGHDIKVFDTPGLYQKGGDESEIRKEIEKSIVSPGLHAVVFVVKIGRFTKEEQEAVEQMKTLFGTSIFRYTIFAFTCIKDLGTQPLEGFVNESAPVYLNDVIRESGSRIVGFDNRDKQTDEHSVEKIISLVAEMSQTNKECLYSRNLFEEAFQANMKRKKEEQEKQDKERQLEFEKATAEKEAALKKKHKEDRNTIEEGQHQRTSEQQQQWKETSEKEMMSIERVHSESLKEIEEKLKSRTNDLKNVKDIIAVDTQLEATGPLLDSVDPQQFEEENQPISIKCFVTKEEETTPEMKLKRKIASDTQLVAKEAPPDSADAQHPQVINLPTKRGNEERLVAKENERGVRDTEVHGPGVHADEGSTGDTVEEKLLELGNKKAEYETRMKEIEAEKKNLDEELFKLSHAMHETRILRWELEHGALGTSVQSACELNSSEIKHLGNNEIKCGSWPGCT